MCMSGSEYMNAETEGVSDPGRAVARDDFDLPGMGTGKLWSSAGLANANHN